MKFSTILFFAIPILVFLTPLAIRLWPEVPTIQSTVRPFALYNKDTKKQRNRPSKPSKPSRRGIRGIRANHALLKVAREGIISEKPAPPPTPQRG